MTRASAKSSTSDRKQVKRCWAHDKPCIFVERDGWSYWLCPVGCWMDIYEPHEKRPKAEQSAGVASGREGE